MGIEGLWGTPAILGPRGLLALPLICGVIAFTPVGGGERQAGLKVNLAAFRRKGKTKPKKPVHTAKAYMVAKAE